MDNFDWIDQYLNGKLDSKEKAAFEKRMQEDQDFAFQVELQGLQESALKELALEERSLDLKRMQKNTTDLDKTPSTDATIKKMPSAKRKPFSLSFLAIAASILFLLGVSYVVSNQFMNPPSENNQVVEQPTEPGTEKEDPVVPQKENEIESKKELPKDLPKEKVKKESLPPKSIKVETPPYKQLAMAEFKDEFAESITLRGDQSDPSKVTDKEVGPMVIKALEADQLYVENKNKEAAQLLIALINEDPFLKDTYDYKLFLVYATLYPESKEAFLNHTQKILKDKEHSYFDQTQSFVNQLIANGLDASLLQSN